ncbi:MAG: cytochrome c [Bacteroidota bacterium]
MKRNFVYHIGTLMVAALFLTACDYGTGQRNVEYAPKMYHSIPLEPYSQVVSEDVQGARPQTIFKDGINAQAAPDGTVPRQESWYRTEKYMPYHISNTSEGYELAGDSLTSPFESDGFSYKDISINCSEETFNNGQILYGKFCVMCHGAKGNGLGILVTGTNGSEADPQGPYPQVPAYNGQLKELPAGKMFHTLTYGKGLMGSYASQLTPKQRWEVICYIQHYQQL